MGMHSSFWPPTSWRLRGQKRQEGDELFKKCLMKVAQQPHKPLGGSNQIWATTSGKDMSQQPSTSELRLWETAAACYTWVPSYLQFSCSRTKPAGLDFYHNNDSVYYRIMYSFKRSIVYTALLNRQLGQLAGVLSWDVLLNRRVNLRYGKICHSFL